MTDTMNTTIKKASEVSTVSDDQRAVAAEQGDVKVRVVDEQSLKSTNNNTNKSSNSDGMMFRKRVFLGLLVLCIIGAIVATVVTLTVSSSSSSNKTTAVSSSSQNQTTTTQQGGTQKPPLSNTSTTTTTTTTTRTPAQVLVSNGLLFNTSVPLFNADIVKGYNGPNDMKADLANAMKFYLNGLVDTNIKANASNTGGTGMGSAGGSTTDKAPQNSMTSEGSGSSNKANSYGTHNQEDGVEEGDVIVSNGDVVFAAYGGYVLVWNSTTGTMITKINIPGFNVTSTWDANYTYWNQPQVQKLLLYRDRLLVIVNGFGSTFPTPDGRSTPILYSYKGTQIRLYSTASLPNMELLYTTNINGYLSSTRAINGKVHIVTSSGIDTWTDFGYPFQIENYNNTSEEQYAATVRKQAELEAIPRFVNELMAELTINSIVPNMFRISLFQSQLTSATMEQSIFSSGLVNSVTLVHSLDMTSTDNSSLQLSVSGAFLPSWSADVYSSTDMLIVSGQQWEFNETSNASSSSTYLLSFQLNGATTTPYSTATIPGYVLNARSVDVVGSILRVATSVVTTWGGWWGPFFAAGSGGIKRALTSEISIGRPFFPQLNRTTENYVILLDLSQPNGTMAELSRLQLGKPDEVFTAVRFFDNIAYAVTFERKDPLYVLDLTNPTNPVVKAELEISGFSENLDPINSDNTLILAIGQETDSNGTILGMQISVFDFTDLTNVKLAQRYVVEKNTSAWSSSDAQWDYQAIRYTDGRLIIPLDIYNWQSPSDEFHGFAIFSADANQITEGCRISTPQPQYVYPVDSNSTETTNTTKPASYYCAWLPRRSFVFDGKVMTTDSHFVKSTDMDTCQEEWSTDIVIEDSSSNRCGW